MIKFLKVRDVNSPTRRTSTNNKPGDAGFDFYIPNQTEEFIHDFIETNKETYNREWHFQDDKIILGPGCDFMIPSGIRALIPWNEALMGKNKSGQATKKKIRKGAQVVDASYQGEIFLHIFNDGHNSTSFSFGEKIMQLVPVYIDCDEHEVFTLNDISLEEFYANHDSERGDGSRGSTGI